MRIVYPDGGDHGSWLAARRHGIGGSDIAAVGGMSRWASPYSLWAHRTGRVSDDAAQTVPMRIGHALEPVAVDLLSEQIGTDIERHDTLIVGGDEPWHLMSPDGTIPSERILVEAKSVSSRAAGAWWHPDGTETVPPAYLMQVQWGLAVYGWDRAYITALIDGRHEVRVVDYDPQLVQAMLSIADEWWWHVCTDTPPPVDASTATEQVLRHLPVAPQPSVVDLDNLDDTEDWHSLFTRRAHAMRLIEEWTSEKRHAESRLRAAMGGASEARLDGARVATWRPGKTGARTLRISYTHQEEK